MQASVLECMRQVRHCVFRSMRVRVARQDIHMCRVSFRLLDAILFAYLLESTPVNNIIHFTHNKMHITHNEMIILNLFLIIMTTIILVNKQLNENILKCAYGSQSQSPFDHTVPT